MLYKYYQDDTVQDEIWSYLTFPLLKNFVDELNKKVRQRPDAIALILTDQSAIFTTKQDRKEESPYWQDTCNLEPILERYFRDKYPEAKILKFQQNSEAEPQSITLRPEDSAQGLDNWNSVLDLIRAEFKKLPNHVDSNNSEPYLVYVSHQAGTPAISSAVQFCSLATYGDRVQFLVSSERDLTKTQLIESPSYLQGLRREEAIELLKRHDYSGVQELVSEFLSVEDKTLLEAAILWNFAKFEDFATELQKLANQEVVKLVKMRLQTWWWTAYESAYLAILRFEQRNTVDALFHGFRAVEGAFSDWGAKHQLKAHIQIINDRPWLQTSILEDVQYFERAKYKRKGDEVIPDNDIAKLKNRLAELQAYERKGGKKKGLIFYGPSLYPIFREVKRSWKNECKSIGRFWDNNNGISEKRNRIFHQLQGLTENELFEIWEVDNCQAWKERLRIYLNYITGESAQSLDQIDSDGRSASLMVKVHQELEKAIAQL